MPPVLIKSRWAENFSKDLLLKFPVDSGRSPAIAMSQGRWTGMDITTIASHCPAIGPSLLLSNILVRHRSSRRSCTIRRPWPLVRRKKVDRDYVPVILQNDFRDNASDLLLAENTRLLWVFGTG